MSERRRKEVKNDIDTVSTREQRKLEAVMRQFEKLEKRSAATSGKVTAIPMADVKSTSEEKMEDNVEQRTSPSPPPAKPKRTNGNARKRKRASPEKFAPVVEAFASPVEITQEPPLKVPKTEEPHAVAEPQPAAALPVVVVPGPLPALEVPAAVDPPPTPMFRSPCSTPKMGRKAWILAAARDVDPPSVESDPMMCDGKPVAAMERAERQEQLDASAERVTEDDRQRQVDAERQQYDEQRRRAEQRQANEQRHRDDALRELVERHRREEEQRRRAEAEHQAAQRLDAERERQADAARKREQEEERRRDADREQQEADRHLCGAAARHVDGQGQQNGHAAVSDDLRNDCDARSALGLCDGDERERQVAAQACAAAGEDPADAANPESNHAPLRRRRSRWAAPPAGDASPPTPPVPSAAQSLSAADAATQGDHVRTPDTWPASAGSPGPENPNGGQSPTEVMRQRSRLTELAGSPPGDDRPMGDAQDGAPQPASSSCPSPPPSECSPSQASQPWLAVAASQGVRVQ